MQPCAKLTLFDLLKFLGGVVLPLRPQSHSDTLYWFYPFFLHSILFYSVLKLCVCFFLSDRHHTTITSARKAPGTFSQKKKKKKSINVPTRISNLNTFIHHIMNWRHSGNENCFEQTTPKWHNQLQ